MRVLALCHLYPLRDASNQGVFVHRMNRALRDAGAEVEVIQPVEWAPATPLARLYAPWLESRQRRDRMLDELDGLPIHHPANVTPRPSRFFDGDPIEREARSVVRYCRARPRLAGADVILAHFLVPDGFQGIRLGAALGIPVVGLAWGDDVHAWPEGNEGARARLLKVLRTLDVPAACSARLARDGNAWLPEPRDDWEVVYGGVELDRFRPVDDPRPFRASAFPQLSAVQGPDARVLLMLAQRTRAKGYVEMLDAWQQVSAAAPGWHLVAAGGDWGDLDIPAEIARRGLQGTAHWIGTQPGERIAELLRASDAFVLPSHNEGLSLSVLEAMATGLPTITTDVGGHAELIRDPAEGWLIPARDTPALVTALRELTGEGAADRARRAARARAAAARIGTPLDNARRMLAILEGAVARRGANRRPAAVGG